MENMEAPIRQERLALINRVLHLDAATYIFGGLGANVGLIESEINRDYERPDFMKWDATSIHRIAVKLAQRGALAPNPRYVEAFQVAFSGDASQKSGIGANEQMILAELSSRGIECTPENILQIIGEKWDSLADNPQYAQQQVASGLRARRIAAMVGDPPTHGFSVQIGPRRYAFGKDGRPHDPNRGMAQGFSLAAKGAWSPGQGKSFEQMSDAEIENIWNLFRTSQDLKSKSVEELRSIVKNGGHSDLHGNHQSIRLPSTGTSRDEGELINPETGVEFTQRQLIAYINNPNDPYAGRKLITHKTSGRVIAEKRQRFEEIIKGLRG